MKYFVLFSMTLYQEYEETDMGQKLTAVNSKACEYITIGPGKYKYIFVAEVRAFAPTISLSIVNITEFESNGWQKYVQK